MPEGYIQFNAEPPQTKQDFIHLFPRFFFFSSLGRQGWTNDHMVKHCVRVTFPVMFDMVPYAFLTKDCYPYQLLPAFLTGQFQKRFRSLHDVPHNIQPADSIE
jgi:hypothetical protein